MDNRRRPFALLPALLPFPLLVGAVAAQVPLAGPLSDATTGPLLGGVVYHAGSVTVPAGATLTARPGAIVKFLPGASLRVDGRFDVLGNAAQPVVLSDVRDDTAGGDTNGDGGATLPAAGSWRGAQYSGTASGRAVHLEVRYAGGFGASVTLSDPSVSFSRCTVRDGSDAGWSLGAVSTRCSLIACAARDNAGFAFDQVPMEAVPALRFPVAVGNGGNGVRVRTGSLGSDVVLGPQNGVVVVQPTFGAVFAVQPGAALTLAAGTVVKFADGVRLDVQGALFAAGTAAEPVVLTGLRDDGAGGDTNGDGAASAPSPGDWQQLAFAATSSASVLTHAHLRYAGRPGSLGAVRLTGAGVTLTDCRIERSAEAGVALDVTARPTLTRLHVQDAAGYPVDGIQLEAVPGMLDCTATGCLFDAPNVGSQAGSSVDEAVAIGPRNGIGGVLRVRSRVDVAASGSLTIEAGTVLKFGPGAALLADGPVTCAATAGAPVWFTSERDDAVGGDTNNDGTTTAPAPGDWGSLFLFDHADGSVLRQARIRYAGRSTFGTNAAVHVTDAVVTIEDCEVRATDGAGLDMHLSDVPGAIRRCVFRDGVNGSAIVNVNWNRLTTFHDNHAFGNQYDRIQVTGGQVTGVAEVRRENLLAGQLHVVGTSIAAPHVTGGARLVLHEGVVLKFAPLQRLWVTGALLTEGTPELPVVLTSERDDGFGGDLNGDGAATQPAPGDWAGLLLHSGGVVNRSLLRHAIVRFAGGANQQAAVVIGTLPNASDGDSDLDSVRVEHSRTDGLRLNVNPSLLRRVVVYRNMGAGVVVAGQNPAPAHFEHLTCADNLTGGVVGSLPPPALPPIVTLRNSILLDGGTVHPASSATYSIAPNQPGLAPPGVNGNLVTGVLFADLAGGDLRLLPSSPAIDGGDPSAPLDPDGTRADIGAYAYNRCEPRAYCAQNMALGGCDPALAFVGVPSLTSGAPFEIVLSEAPNGSLGYFFYRRPPVMVLGTTYGWLCMPGPGIRRSGVIGAAGGNPLVGPCTGTFTFDFNAWLRGGNDTSVTIGETLLGQFFYRDGGAQSLLRYSPAIAFTLCP